MRFGNDPIPKTSQHFKKPLNFFKTSQFFQNLSAFQSPLNFFKDLSAFSRPLNFFKTSQLFQDLSTLNHSCIWRPSWFRWCTSSEQEPKMTFFDLIFQNFVIYRKFIEFWAQKLKNHGGRVICQHVFFGLKHWPFHFFRSFLQKNMGSFMAKLWLSCVTWILKDELVLNKRMMPLREATGFSIRTRRKKNFASRKNLLRAII